MPDLRLSHSQHDRHAELARLSQRLPHRLRECGDIDLEQIARDQITRLESQLIPDLNA